MNPGKKPAQNKRKNNNAKSKRNNDPRNRLTQPGAASSSYAPTARTKVVRTQRASVKSLPNGDIRVVHREYLQDLVSTLVTFESAALAINPGIAASFPWLSKLARNFESYRFNRLTYIYETEAATTQAGTVMLGVDYDVNDAAPASKLQLMAYRNSVRSAPWNPCAHRSNGEDLNKRKSYYVRPSGSLSANLDQKLYDVGNLFIATQGTVAATLGEIYVEYDVTLMTPEYIANEIVGGSFIAAGTMSAANPMGSTVALADANNFGVTMTGGNSILTFLQLGDYVLTYSFTGTAITVAPLAQVLGAGVALLNATTSVINGAATDTIIRSELRVSSLIASTADITLTATTVTGGRLDVAIVPPNSLT